MTMLAGDDCSSKAVGTKPQPGVLYQAPEPIGKVLLDGRSLTVVDEAQVRLGFSLVCLQHCFDVVLLLL